MYVVVRTDLPPNHRAVQGGHALAAVLLGGTTEWDNGPLVILGAKNEGQLLKESARLGAAGIRHAIWREPDMNNEATAIAAYAAGEVFRRRQCI